MICRYIDVEMYRYIDVEKAAKIRRLGETEILNKQTAELAQDRGVPWPPKVILKVGRPKF